ncbi:MAG: hypothetical protein WCE21_01390 [Candidatus Babeliales bacterium]
MAITFTQSLFLSSFFAYASVYAAESYHCELEDMSTISFDMCLKELKQYLSTIDLTHAVDTEDLASILIEKINRNPSSNFPLLCTFMRNNSSLKRECQTILNRTLIEYIDQKSKGYYQDLIVFATRTENVLIEE